VRCPGLSRCGAALTPSTGSGIRRPPAKASLPAKDPVRNMVGRLRKAPGPGRAGSPEPVGG